MRSLSSRIIDGAVDLYLGVTSQDPDGAVQYVYPAIPSRANVPCSAQPGAIEEIVDDQNRLTQTRVWTLFFAQPIGPAARAMFTYVDQFSVKHTLFARVGSNLRAQVIVYCIERI